MPHQRDPLTIVRSRVVTTAVFDTYWRFAAERQNAFFRRAAGMAPPWTEDPILLKYRFTNAYRASDRVSQFLIRQVQAQGPQDERALFFRTILFKLFNRISTWQLLETAVGSIHPDLYDFDAYDRVLTQALVAGQPVYSSAYIMPAAARESARKHQVHLKLLESMMRDDMPSRLASCSSMQEAFRLLRSCPFLRLS